MNEECWLDYLRIKRSIITKILFIMVLIVLISGTDGWLVNAQDGGGTTDFAGKTHISSARFDQQERLRVIVQFKVPLQNNQTELMTPAIRRAQTDLKSEMKEYHIKIIHEFDHLPYMAIEVDRAGFEGLLKSPLVLGVEEDKENHPFLLQSVPLIRANEAWTAGYTGAEQVVAILDTGVDKNHPALSSKVVSEACYSSGTIKFCPGGAAESIASNSALPCSDSRCDHGTHVAGIVAANGSVVTGVAKDSKLIAVQVFSLTSSGGLTAYDSDIAKGLDRVYALRNDFNISSVNLSLGSTTVYSDHCDALNSLLKTSIDKLRGAGIATVAASGNGGSTTGISSPACISTVVSVGASTDSDAVASFSNSAAILDLLAPGSNIYSTVPGSSYGTKSGTSMATPHVSGAWALIKSARPDATVTEVLQAFKDSGVPITDTRDTDPQNHTTKPRIDVFAALLKILFPIPSLPENILASDGDYSDKVRVTWNLAEHATYYQVFRDTAPFTTNAELVGDDITASLFDDTTLNGLESGTIYYYWIKACNISGCSDFSTPDAGWIHKDGLIAPTNVQASDGLFSQQVRISWNGVGGATGYLITRNTTNSTVDATVLSSNTLASPFEDLTALHDIEYYYWVQACDNDGCSPYSEADVGYLLDEYSVFLPLLNK